ncbi:esterase/lipase family protein [Photobacterium lipolyticum]|nr:hypothetical protein [Photobacterium lipolyticum]
MAERDRSKKYLVFVMGEKIVRLLWWTGLKKATSIFNNKHAKLEQFIQEFLTDFAKVGFLTKVLGEKPLEPFSADDSELNEKYYDNSDRYTQALMNFFIDLPPFKKECKIKPLHPPVDVHKITPTPNETWFFLNGIGTNEDMAKVNARMLSDIFKRPITLLHNPGNGFMADLIEVMKGRAFNLNTAIAESARDHIWSELKIVKEKMRAADKEMEKSYKVVVIAHSQGGLIISNVVRMLLQDHGGNPLLNQLEVYTFASAHDQYPSSCCTDAQQHQVPFTEHFANKEDYVSQVGVLKAGSKKTVGNIYIKNGAGHLLNFHYLRDFVHGRYEGKESSRLFSLLGGCRLADAEK